MEVLQQAGTLTEINKQREANIKERLELEAALAATVKRGTELKKAFVRSQDTLEAIAPRAGIRTPPRSTPGAGTRSHRPSDVKTTADHSATKKT